jgi:hypothetical protein
VDELRHLILRRFYQDDHGLSRNQNFEAYKDQAVQHAARAGNLLRSLRSDLLERALDSLSLSRVTNRHGEPRLLLELRWPDGWRRTYLTSEELGLLRENPEINARLSDA